MDESHLRDLFEQSTNEVIPPLPPRFADDVIRQTRLRQRVERLERLWPVFTAASLVALTLAGGTGLWLARDRQPGTPPRLTLFQAQSDTNPFLAR